MGSVRSEAAAVTPLPPTKPNTAPPPAIKAVPPAIPRPPAANAPPPTAARLALVRAAPDRPATADPARTGAMTGASVNAAPPVATATAAVPAAPTIFLVRLPSNKPAFLFSALAVSCTGDLSKSPLTSLHSSSRTLESNLRGAWPSCPRSLTLHQNSLVSFQSDMRHTGQTVQVQSEPALATWFRFVQQALQSFASLARD